MIRHSWIAGLFLKGKSMDIHSRLKEIRQKKNLTMEELVEKIGYTQAAISQWENGQRLPRIGAVVAYSNFFKVSCDWILKGKKKDGTS